ncbi:MAG: transcription termination/antitermination protein NusA [Candidatus Nealsonbacteria bacterium]|nr:transcription termination/antitermination protein NusA [Candidatus Nealsonbacteria bacterium]
MDLKSFAAAINQISEERGIPKEKVIETIEQALSSAYKKDYGKKGQLIKAKLDLDTGEVEFWQVKLIVDDKMIYSEAELEELKTTGRPETPEMAGEGQEKKIRFNPERHLVLAEAKKVKKGVKAGEELEFPLESQSASSFGRIAAQTAKQVVLQKIKEIEKETVFSEFQAKEGEAVSGTVQRIEGRNVFLNIGKTLGILTREEQVPGEFYRPGQRLKVYLLKTENTPRGPVIFLSRSHPKLISRLFELEVPEIASGQVQIKSIAREAGSRSKVAVFSNDERIDPIGAAVGQRGTRVMTVINELGGEKIDIINWSDDPADLIANALSPAKVLEVKTEEKNLALAIVPEDQLSLAIGKDGQNVRLAAKLTGWKIDVRSEAESSSKSAEESTPEETPVEPPAEIKEGSGQPAEKKTKNLALGENLVSHPARNQKATPKKSQPKVKKDKKEA